MKSLGDPIGPPAPVLAVPKAKSVLLQQLPFQFSLYLYSPLFPLPLSSFSMNMSASPPSSSFSLPIVLSLFLSPFLSFFLILPYSPFVFLFPLPFSLPLSTPFRFTPQDAKPRPRSPPRPHPLEVLPVTGWWPCLLFTL